MATAKPSAVRPSIRDVRPNPGSPHTPSNRHISSTSSSPFPSYWRTEEDPIIIELDPRYLRAGFQGDSAPQCTIRFTPQNSRRVGDYRVYLPGYRRRKEDVRVKSKEYELWRNDLQDVDLGLLEDKLERAVREAYNKHLLVDAGVARVILVLPSLVPHPVLDTILTLLFQRWQISSVTLLPGPTMAVAAAGLRSGLVVDIGWEETIVHAIYEFREICVKRCTRGLKSLVFKMWDFLEDVRKKQDQSLREELVLDFDFVEEFIERAGKCHALFPHHGQGLVEQTEAVTLSEDKGESVSTLMIDWPTHSSARMIGIPKSKLQQICSESFFGSRDQDHLDDHEQPVDQLLYNTLLAVSSDVRSSCISRIIFTGEGSSISNLPEHVFSHVNTTIDKYGWTPVRGKHFNTTRNRVGELAHNRSVPVDARHHAIPTSSESKIDIDLHKRKKEDTKPTPSLRQIDSLGTWAGASLVASLKSKSFVEIERERYLSHGIAGANRNIEQYRMSQQAKPVKAGERTSWTLAGWG
ncbi:hypothetical protein B0A52_09904 [Exophiala mesophila]|uniref:Actin-related protein RO7 n=1 Tax=Exophiala mesophila TaxID=212818 RepID=A0A438MSU8_EXOME|nr:hypothetical protein B0A52_09904 [Exophiala mesophila]